MRPPVPAPHSGAPEVRDPVRGEGGARPPPPRGLGDAALTLRVTRATQVGPILCDAELTTLECAKELEPKGIKYLAVGVSGGEEGARNGPSLMPGGPRDAWDVISPIFKKCAAIHTGK